MSRTSKYTMKIYYKKKKLIDRYKLFKGCSQCGYKKCSYALQFDHIDPTNKNPRMKNYGLKNKHSIGFQLLSWPDLRAEIRKCDVLCANCHLEKTYGERKN